MRFVLSTRIPQPPFPSQEFPVSVGADCAPTIAVSYTHLQAIQSQQRWRELPTEPHVLITAAAESADAAMHEADAAVGALQFGVALKKYQQAAQFYDLASSGYTAIVQRFQPAGMAKYQQLDGKEKAAADQTTCQTYRDLLANLLSQYQQSPLAKIAQATDMAGQANSAMAAGDYPRAVDEFSQAEKIYSSMPVSYTHLEAGVCQS